MMAPRWLLDGRTTVLVLMVSVSLATGKVLFPARAPARPLYRRARYLFISWKMRALVCVRADKVWPSSSLRHHPSHKLKECYCSALALQLTLREETLCNPFRFLFYFLSWCWEPMLYLIRLIWFNPCPCFFSLTFHLGHHLTV